MFVEQNLCYNSILLSVISTLDIFQIAGGIPIRSKPYLFFRVPEYILRFLFVSTNDNHSLGANYMGEIRSLSNRTKN